MVCCCQLPKLLPLAWETPVSLNVLLSYEYRLSHNYITIVQLSIGSRNWFIASEARRARRACLASQGKWAPVQRVNGNNLISRKRFILDIWFIEEEMLIFTPKIQNQHNKGRFYGQNCHAWCHAFENSITQPLWYLEAWNLHHILLWHFYLRY